MRRAFLVVILCACGGSRGADAPDGALPADAQSALDSGSAGPLCDASNDALVACFTFDDSLDDSSGYENHAVGEEFYFADGINGKALGLSGASDVRVPASSSLDAVDLTVELWVRVDIGDAAVFVRNDNQYQLGRSASGGLTVGLNTADDSGRVLFLSETVYQDEWTHVAMTYQDARLMVYVDGEPALPQPWQQVPLVAADGGDLLIGRNDIVWPSRLIGLIDNLRIWNVARTPDEICRDAGSC